MSPVSSIMVRASTRPTPGIDSSTWKAGSSRTASSTCFASQTDQVIEGLHHDQVACHCERQARVGQQILHRFQGEPFDLVAIQGKTEIARHEVRNAHTISLPLLTDMSDNGGWLRIGG